MKPRGQKGHEPDLHHGRLGGEIEAADSASSPACRLMAKPSARSSRRQSRRTSAKAHRAAVLNLHARRAQGPGRHRAEDRDSGYLTRRLVDVAQDVIISEHDCGTWKASTHADHRAGEVIEPLRDRIIGRVSLEKLKDFEGKTIVEVNQEIDEDLASAVQAAGIERSRSAPC